MTRKKQAPSAVPPSNDGSTDDGANKLYGRDAYIARLLAGETVTFGEPGNSMMPIIKHREKCTYQRPASPEELKEGDIVFCKVGPWHYTHLIKRIRIENGKRVFTIGNNHGRINGDTDWDHIYGKVIQIG